MVQGLLPTHQGPLFNLGTTQLLNSSDLQVGVYIFYFGVDLNMNGLLDMSSIYYDSEGRGETSLSMGKNSHRSRGGYAGTYALQPAPSS